MSTVQLTQRPLIVLAAAVVLQIVLISAQVRTTAGIPFIQVVTFGVFAEIQRVMMTGIDGVRSLWTGYVALRDAQAENEQLRQEVRTLQVRLQEERAEAQRAESLRQLLDLRPRAGVETVAAEVIAGPARSDFRDMTIDKGSLHGVAHDMAVISPAGVVGRVILSSPRAARVQMLVDLNAAAGAMIERTRVQGLVVGGQGATLRMDYVPATAEVTAGDRVVTSGIDKVYPKGFLIGTVASVSRGSGTFYELIIQPAVDFSRLEEVLVVTTPPPAITAEQIAREAEALATASRQAQISQNASPRAATPPARPLRLIAPQNETPGGPGNGAGPPADWCGAGCR